MTFDVLTDLARWRAVPKDDRPAVLLAALKQTAGPAEWRPLWSIAKRESAANYMVEHRLPADAAGATKVWQRLQNTTYKSNPYRDPALWGVGRGPWGMMTPYYVSRWDADASPLVLHHPWVASVVALRTVAGIVRSGAQNWTQVNEAWASGRWSRDSEGARDRAARFRARLDRDGWGHLADARPNVSDAGWGTKPQDDQVGRVAELVRAFTGGNESGQGGEDKPPPVPPVAPASTPWLGLTLGAMAAGILLWTMTSRLVRPHLKSTSRSSA